jgi:hypothetical protein
MEIAVREMAERMEEAFEYSAIWYLEKGEFEELTNEEGRNVVSFYALEKSVKEMSPALMQDTTELAGKYPEVFELSLRTLLSSVSDQFRPTTAAEFVEKLNSYIRHEAVALAPG